MRQLLLALSIAAVAAPGAMAETKGGSGSTGAGTAKGHYQKLSDAECESVWMKANPSNASSITEEQARQYISDVKAVNHDKDGKIERKEFMDACGKGLVKSSATTGAGAGTSGSGAEHPSKQPR